MATSDIRLTVIQIVNKVQERMGVNKTTNLDTTKHSGVLLELLNDVIDEVSDFGDWPQMYREWLVTAQSSVGVYEIVASANVQRVEEISWNNDTAALDLIDGPDMRRLQRISSYGIPRQYSIIEVSGVNPKFRCTPIPTTAAVFTIAGYKKTRMFNAAVTADASALPSFPGRVLTQGLYAKALLEEAGGEPTQQYQAAYTEYLRMRKEALNRWTSDTGTCLQFVPG